MKYVKRAPNTQRNKNRYGQYFTPEIIANFMIDMADVSVESKILEPCSGEGVFLDLLLKRDLRDLTAYEIDPTLSNRFSFVKHTSFVSADIKDEFDLIIGNPPYIRWANLEEDLKQELLSNRLWNKYFNMLCDYLYIFILKSIELLKENGQLIFICPEYWLNTTNSISLRNYMMKNGYFERIYHFNETPIFDKVTVSTIIFKYIKSSVRSSNIDVTKYYSNKKLNPLILNGLKNKEEKKQTEYISVSQFKINERWLLIPDSLIANIERIEIECQKHQGYQPLSLFNDKKQYHTIEEFCDIGNGLVSGLDKAFLLNGTPINDYEKEKIIKVIKAKDIEPFYHKDISDYFLLNDVDNEKELKEKYPNLFAHLQYYKINLEKRYQYNRNINYWEWVFLRNFNLFNKKEKKIFVPCKERISNKNYFRFALVEEGFFPTQDVTAIFKKNDTKESIEYILSYLNNYRVFDWLRHNGIIKGNIVEFSEKPIASIPFRTIDWNNPFETELHDNITVYCKQYIEKKDLKYLESINDCFDRLFE